MLNEAIGYNEQQTDTKVIDLNRDDCRIFFFLSLKTFNLHSFYVNKSFKRCNRVICAISRRDLEHKKTYNI